RDIRPVPRQGFGDGAPDPLGGPRHDHDFHGQHHGRAAASASTVAARLVRSCTFSSRSSGAIRLASPVRTFPGPTSTSVWIPILTSVCTDSSHNTDEASCRTNDVRTSAALLIGLASTLLISGTVRFCIGTRSTSMANRAAAACISDVCTGTLTGKGITLRHPLALAKRAASSTAAFSPKLCPATAVGRRPARSNSRSATTLTVNNAGCVYSVRLSCSTGPCTHRAATSYPST